MNPKCIIDGEKAVFLLKKDGFDEYICPKCDLSFVYPQPTAEWLKDEVYSYESGYQANKRADLTKMRITKRYRKILDFLRSKKKSGSLLDIGCSSGQFMYWARERGFKCSGIEINKRTADLALQNNFEVFQGFLGECLYPKKSFDIVYLGDVIEHVNDPSTVVREAISFLKDDGIIVFSTPNMDCFWSKITLILFKLFGIPWAAATPPHHLFQFNFNNLGKLVAEYNFKSIYSIFTRPSSLKYELGSLHLYKYFKNNKNISSFIFMVTSFAIYIFTYYLNIFFSVFNKKDFQMVVFYKKLNIHI
ncbi:MAG: class I SAM-dependent methyltransferase [Minisyncoccia bacterium]